MRDPALPDPRLLQVDDVGDGELHRLAVGVAGLERGAVTAEKRRLLGEAPLDPFDRRVGRLAAEPERQAERPEILGAPAVLAAEPELGDRFKRALLHRDRERAIGGAAAVVDGAVLEPGLHIGALVEGALVIDDGAAALQKLDVGDERGGIEGDQHVSLVAGRQNLARPELHLVGGDAERCSGRRADLGREFRQCHQVGAARRGRRSKLVAGKLDAVAGIAGEADDERGPDGLCQTAGPRLRSFGGFANAHECLSPPPAYFDAQSGWIGAPIAPHERADITTRRCLASRSNISLISRPGARRRCPR